MDFIVGTGYQALITYYLKALVKDVPYFFSSFSPSAMTIMFLLNIYNYN